MHTPFLRFFWLLFLLPGFCCCSVEQTKEETVVLLHGMGRTKNSMLLLKSRLADAGFNVVSETYPSTEQSIAEHVRWLDNLLVSCCAEKEAGIHFVTHSLGGIVVRLYLSENELPSLGRVVMLSPPNKGSELADYLKDWRIYKFGTGPSGQELGTAADSTPNRIGPVNFELGVITGDATLNPFFSDIIPGPDDGKVSVASARVDGMTDFLVVPHSHAFIMNSADVADQVVAFLKTGAFAQPKPTVEE